MRSSHEDEAAALPFAQTRGFSEAAPDDAAEAASQPEADAPIPEASSDAGETDPSAAADGDLGSTAVSGPRGDVVEQERFEPGDVVPTTRYQIVALLGEGGMGVVYEAEHLDVGRRVALKILRAGFGPQSPAVRQFRTEARAASKIGSENIADVYDFAELNDGRLLFTMELLDGPDLADELKSGPLELERAIPILRQLCEALAAAHDAELVHRDIKPSNVVLVSRQGRADVVKLVDFGVSTMLTRGKASEELAGTPYYLSPEIILGLPFDARADMYSFGCLAYEMLVGRPPFRGSDVQQIFDGHLDGTAQPPSVARGDGTSPALDALILRCLEKRAKDRYADMRDLHAAICEAQISAGIATPWDDLPVPEVDSERRDAILRGYAALAGHPELLPARRIGRALWTAAASFVAILAVAWILLSGAREPSRVDELVTSARAAAARAHFVYPSKREPDAPTAYGYVLELETLEGDDAPQGRIVAQRLREEFADTLVRLADDYWEAEGGKAFAVAYYEQALAFDPDHATAAARADLTAEELDELRTKTETRSFEEEDLVEEPPLLVHGELESPAEPAPAPSVAKRPAPAPSRPPPPRVEPPPPKLPPPPPPTPSVADPEPEPPPAPARPAGPTALDLAKEGAAARREGRTEDAIELFTRALAKNAKERTALAAMSEIEFDAGRWAEAADYAERAVAVAPRSGGNRIRLGDAYYRLGRFADAKSEYEMAAELGHSGAAYRLQKVEQKTP